MSHPIRQIKTFLGVTDFLQLFPPPQVNTYHYFDGVKKYPFDATADEHSPINAWWMAEYALLSYADRLEVEAVLHQLFAGQKHSLFWLASKATNTQGFGIETSDYILLSFRGTEFPHPSTLIHVPNKLLDIVADIRTDIQRFKPEKIATGVPTFNTHVHPGFAKAMQSIWPQLQTRVLTSAKPIWLVGHSLGGAIATLLAYQLADRVAALYTYGCPCVGTPDFVQSFNEKGLQEKTFRYQHGNDAIAKAFELTTLGYQHVGQLHKLDAGERRGLLGEMLHIALGSTIGLDQLDHAPILYSYECWNEISN